LFFIIPQIFEKHRDAQNWDFIYNKEYEIDIIYMGSSLTFTSLDPNVIDPIIGCNSFNLGSSAQNIIQSYYNLIEVLKYRKVELIILDVNTIIAESNKVGFIYNNLSGMKFSENKINSFLNSTDKSSIEGVIDISKDDTKEDWGKIVSLLIKEKFNWKNDFKSFDRIFRNENKIKNSKGFYGRDKIISLEKYNSFKNEELKYEKISTKNQKYFSEFIDLCISNKIDLILIQTPILENRIIESLDLFINKYNLPYFSFKNDKDYIDYNYKDFSDKLHFSYSGAQKFSLVFADSLNKYLNNKKN
tara:strand:- start:1198 stop:2103 length:906 start_codon:yes stop_codon:yes gene_type:complete